MITSDGVEQQQRLQPARDIDFPLQFVTLTAELPPPSPHNQIKMIARPTLGPPQYVCSTQVTNTATYQNGSLHDTLPIYEYSTSLFNNN